MTHTQREANTHVEPVIAHDPHTQQRISEIRSKTQAVRSACPSLAQLYTIPCFYESLRECQLDYQN